MFSATGKASADCFFPAGDSQADGERSRPCIVRCSSDEEAFVEGLENVVWEDDSVLAAADVVTADAGLSSRAAGGLKSYDNINMARHAITWGRHTGLYDGMSVSLEAAWDAMTPG